MNSPDEIRGAENRREPEPLSGLMRKPRRTQSIHHQRTQLALKLHFPWQKKGPLRFRGGPFVHMARGGLT